MALSDGVAKSGQAADCKSVDVGSNPATVSTHRRYLVCALASITLYLVALDLFIDILSWKLVIAWLCWRFAGKLSEATEFSVEFEK